MGTHTIPYSGAQIDTAIGTGLGQGYGVCSTAGAISDKVASLSGYVLTKGGIVAVKFDNAVPANATLSINSQTAKPIYYRGSAITSNVIKSGDTVAFMYDGGYYRYLCKDAPDNSSGDGYVWQDADGYVHLSPDEGTYISVDSLTVTENGTYTAPTGFAYNPVTVNVSGGGGGGTPAPVKQINFIDYDGTILYSYTSEEWESVTVLPDNPSHDGLVAQGWNWTKAQIDAQLTGAPEGPVWVGQMYVTESGDTEIDVEFVDSARLSPYLALAPNGTVEIDWGDGSTHSTVTGTSLTTIKNTQHTYSNIGYYTIKIHVVSGSFAFESSSTYTLLNKNTTSGAIFNRVYSNCVQAVRIGNNASIGNYAFGYCFSLDSITIPSSVTSIGKYAFNSCYSLASVTIPSGVTSIGLYMIYSCYKLAYVSIPNSVTSIGESVFQTCYGLASITIPSNITGIGVSAFNNCYSLASITIPSSVTSIGNYAFNNCYGAAEYHFKPSAPPTLGSTVFLSSADHIIYVPSASLNAYKTAANWSKYASKMRGE